MVRGGSSGGEKLVAAARDKRGFCMENLFADWIGRQWSAGRVVLPTGKRIVSGGVLFRLDSIVTAIQWVFGTFAADEHGSRLSNGGWFA